MDPNEISRIVVEIGPNLRSSIEDWVIVFSIVIVLAAFLNGILRD